MIEKYKLVFEFKNGTIETYTVSNYKDNGDTIEFMDEKSKNGDKITFKTEKLAKMVTFKI